MGKVRGKNVVKDWQQMLHEILNRDKCMKEMCLREMKWIVEKYLSIIMYEGDHINTIWECKQRLDNILKKSLWKIKKI